MAAGGGTGWYAEAVGAAVAMLFIVAPAFASDASKAAAPKYMLQLSMEPVHQRVVDFARRGGAQIVDAYRKSPVLVIGLALAGAVPLLAGFVAFGRAMRRRRARSEIAAPVLDLGRSRVGDKAWIEAAPDKSGGAIAFTGEILRIGRHSDNDIALDHVSVHRHHALIQRTPDHDFLLIDLTAGTGNVLQLNGAAIGRAMLRDGDRISLGECDLTFRLGTEIPGHARPPARRPTHRFVTEMKNDERDADDESTGRAADRVETRRLGPADRLVARGSDRRRS